MVAEDGFAALQGQGAVKHRAGADAGVELAVFAAGIDSGGQVGEQRGIKFAAGESGVELLRIHAAQVGAQAAGDHVAGKLRGVAAEQREQRPPAEPFAQRPAPVAHVGQQQVAEGDRRQPRPAPRRAGQAVGKRGFIGRVVALLRDPCLHQRQSGGVGLGQ